MAIAVPKWLDDLFFALMGERMPQANEDLAYLSHEAFKSFANKLRKLAELIIESVGAAGQVLPPGTAQNYVRTAHVLTDDGGTNHVTEFAKQMDDISDGRVKTSINIAESKINILIQLAVLAAQLLFLAVMAFFTGGATSGEAVEAKLRTRAQILVLLQLLAQRTHLLPTLSEALEEAFTTLAARLALMLTAAPGRKPHGIDVKDVVLSGVTGGLTSIFDHIFHGAKNAFKGLFKKFDIGAGFDTKFADKNKMPGLNSNPGSGAVAHGGKNLTSDGLLSNGGKYGAKAADEGLDAVVEGFAESLAVFAVFGQGFSAPDFYGSVVSNLNTNLMFKGTEKAGLGLRDLAFSQNLNVTPHSASTGPTTGPAKTNGGSTPVSEPGKDVRIPTTGTQAPTPASYAPGGITEAGPFPATTTPQTDLPDMPHVSVDPASTGAAHGANPATVSGGGNVPAKNTGADVTHDHTTPGTPADDGANVQPPAEVDAGTQTAPGHGATTLPNSSQTGPVAGPGKTAHAPSDSPAVMDDGAAQDSPDAQDVPAARPDTVSATGQVATSGAGPAVSAGNNQAPTGSAPASAGPATGAAAGTNTPAAVKADGTGPAHSTSGPAGQDRPKADADRSTQRNSTDAVPTVSDTTHTATTAGTTTTHGQDTTAGPVDVFEDSRSEGLAAPAPTATVSQTDAAKPDRVTAEDPTPTGIADDLTTTVPRADFPAETVSVPVVSETETVWAEKTTETGAFVGVRLADKAALLHDIDRKAKRFGKLREETAIKPAAEAHLLLVEKNVALPSILPGDSPKAPERLAVLLRDALAMALHEGPRNEAQALTVAGRDAFDLHALRTVMVGGAPTALNDTAAGPSRTALTQTADVHRRDRTGLVTGGVAREADADIARQVEAATRADDGSPGRPGPAPVGDPVDRPLSAPLRTGTMPGDSAARRLAGEPGPLGREGLEALANDVVAVAGRGDGQDCVILLTEFMRRVHGQRGPGGGVRAGESLDDSVVGLRGAPQNLLPGADWHRIPSWSHVSAVLCAEADKSQAPTMALIVAQRGAGADFVFDRTAAMGHAFAAVATPGAEGHTWWLEFQRPEGARVTVQAPDREALHAHAVVVSRGRVLADALLQDTPSRTAPAVFQRAAESESLARSLVDRPLDPRVGAMGFEGETSFVVAAKDAANWSPKLEIVTSPHLSITTDLFRDQLVAEVVTRPINSLRGEALFTHERRTFDEVRDVFERLRKASPGTPLTKLFPESHGFTVHPAARRAIYQGEYHAGRLSLQITVGIPLNGLKELLEQVGRRALFPDSVAHRHLMSGREFADSLTQRFTRQEQYGNTDRDVLHGFAHLVYTQVAALTYGVATGDEVSYKSFTPVASRTSLSALRAALPQSVRQFLRAESDWIGDTFTRQFYRDNRDDREIRLTDGMGEPIDLLEQSPLLDEQRENFRVRDYLRNALVSVRPDEVITQNTALSLTSHFTSMDDHFGTRSGAPLAVLEMRSYGDRDVAVRRNWDRYLAELKGYYNELSAVARRADDRAWEAQRQRGRPDPRWDTPVAQVAFPERNRGDVPTQELQTIEHFATQIGQELARRHGAGLPGLVVHVEGGGNGSSARDVGRQRAEAVAQHLRHFLTQHAQHNHWPTGLLDLQPASRAKGPTVAPTDLGTANGQDRAAQRSVILWSTPRPAAGSTAGPQLHVFPFRPDETWDSKTHRVLQGALLNAVLSGEIGTPYMTGLVKALDATHRAAPTDGTRLVPDPQPTSFPSAGDLVTRMTSAADARDADGPGGSTRSVRRDTGSADVPGNAEGHETRESAPVSETTDPLVAGVDDGTVREALGILRGERFRFPMVIGTSGEDQVRRGFGESVVRSVAEILDTRGRTEAVLFARVLTSRLYEAFPDLQRRDGALGGAPQQGSRPRSGGPSDPRAQGSASTSASVQSPFAAAPGGPLPWVPPRRPRVDYGKIGAEIETDWQVRVDDDLWHGELLAENDVLTLTAEQLKPGESATLEIVGAPIGFDGAPGGVSEADFWESLEHVLTTLQRAAAGPGSTINRLFGPQNGFRLLEYADAVVEKEDRHKPSLLSPQWTVGMHPSELFDFIVEDVDPLSVQSAPTAHLDAAAGVAFAQDVAGHFYAATHGLPDVHPSVAWHTVDETEYRSLAGLLLLVFTQAVTIAHRGDDVHAGKAGEGMNKAYAFIASRHDPVVLATALPPRARQFLGEHADAVLQAFSTHARRVLRDPSRDPLEATIQGHGTVEDYLRGFIDPGHPNRVGQQALGIETRFPELDGGKVLVELRDLTDGMSIGEIRRSYEDLKRRTHERYEAAARRNVLDPRHHDHGRSLQLTFANDGLASTLERLVRDTRALDTFRHRLGHDYRPLEEGAVRTLVQGLLTATGTGAVRAGAGSSAAGSSGGTPVDVLRRLDSSLSELAIQVNLSDFDGRSWEAVRPTWARAMHDAAVLHERLSGESADWPPLQVAGDWERHSAVAYKPRKGIKNVDEAVRAMLRRPGTTTYQEVLAKISEWRDGKTADNPRASAVARLEREVLHRLGGAVEDVVPPSRPSAAHGARPGAGDARWPRPSAAVLQEWADRFGYAREYLGTAPDAGSLRERAERITAAHHVTPASPEADSSAGARAYRKLYGQVVDVVAFALAQKKHTADPERWGVRAAHETAEAFGSARPGPAGGTRPGDPSGAQRQGSGSAGGNAARPPASGSRPGTTDPVVEVWSADTEDAFVTGALGAVWTAVREKGLHHPVTLALIGRLASHRETMTTVQAGQFDFLEAWSRLPESHEQPEATPGPTGSSRELRHDTPVRPSDDADPRRSVAGPWSSQQSSSGDARASGLRGREAEDEPGWLPQAYADGTRLPVPSGLAEVRAALEGNGVLVGEVRGDGDCFFNSVILTMGLHTLPSEPVRTATELRERLAAYLETQRGAAHGIWARLRETLPALAPEGLTREQQWDDLVHFVRTPGAWDASYGDLIPYLMTQMHDMGIHVVQWNPLQEPRVWGRWLSEGDVPPRDGQRWIALVRLNTGPGTEHWAPTLRVGDSYPAGTTAAMWTSASQAPTASGSGVRGGGSVVAGPPRDALPDLGVIERDPGRGANGLASAGGSVFEPYVIPDGERVSDTTRDRVELLNAFYKEFPDMIGHRPSRGSESTKGNVHKKVLILSHNLAKRGIDPTDKHLIGAFEHFRVKTEKRTKGDLHRVFLVDPVRSKRLLQGPATAWDTTRSTRDHELYQYHVKNLRNRGLKVQRLNLSSIVEVIQQGLSWEFRGGDTSRVFVTMSETKQIDQLNEFARLMGLRPGVVPPCVPGPRKLNDLRGRVGDFFWHLQYTGVPESRNELVTWLTEHGFHLTRYQAGDGVVMMRLPVPDGARDPGGASVYDVLDRTFPDWRSLLESQAGPSAVVPGVDQEAAVPQVAASGSVRGNDLGVADAPEPMLVDAEGVEAAGAAGEPDEGPRGGGAVDDGERVARRALAETFLENISSPVPHGWTADTLVDLWDSADRLLVNEVARIAHGLRNHPEVESYFALGLSSNLTLAQIEVAVRQKLAERLHLDVLRDEAEARLLWAAAAQHTRDNADRVLERAVAAVRHGRRRTVASSETITSATRSPMVGMALTQSESTDALNQQLLTENLETLLRGRVRRQAALDPTARQDQADFDVARVLRDLRPDMQPGRADAFGGDPFGVRRPKPAPEFMRPGGKRYDFSALRADQRTEFFARLDLKRRVGPTAAQLDVTSLPHHRDSVVVGASASRSSGFGVKRQKVPKLLHSIWYGPLFDDGPHGARTEFRANIAEAARLNPGWRIAHWTDVTRSEIDEVRDSFDPRTATERQSQIRDMLEWAEGIENLVLVNEDEIYNADTPMTLQSQVLTERARGGKSLAGASDMARIEHLRRFGGVYSDGDNKIFDLSQVVHRTALRPDGFALLRADLPENPADGAHRDSRPMNNAAIVSVAANAATQHYLRLLAENYQTSLPDLLRRGAKGLQQLSDDLIGQEATPYPAVHKPSREVTHRTGPNALLFTRLAAALGHTDPDDREAGDRFLLGSIPPDAIKVESRGSWNVGYTDGARGVSHERLTAAVRSIVVGLHAELHNRPGGLLLKTIDDTVRSLDLPETQRVPVWGAALTLFHESLGRNTGQVRWIASGVEVNPPQEAVSQARSLFPQAEYVHSGSHRATTAAGPSTRDGTGTGGPGRQGAPTPPMSTGTTGVSYPAVDAVTRRRWEQRFAQARENLAALDDQRRQDLLRDAARIMANRHQAPPIIREGLQPGSPGEAYRALHDDITTLIADHLHREPAPHLATAERPAWALSEQLRKEFRTHATTGGAAGSHSDPQPVYTAEPPAPDARSALSPGPSQAPEATRPGLPDAAEEPGATAFTGQADAVFAALTLQGTSSGNQLRPGSGFEQATEPGPDQDDRDTSASVEQSEEYDDLGPLSPEEVEAGWASLQDYLDRAPGVLAKLPEEVAERLLADAHTLLWGAGVELPPLPGGTGKADPNLLVKVREAVALATHVSSRRKALALAVAARTAFGIAALRATGIAGAPRGAGHTSGGSQHAGGNPMAGPVQGTSSPQVGRSAEAYDPSSDLPVTETVVAGTPGAGTRIRPRVMGARGPRPRTGPEPRNVASSNPTASAAGAVGTGPSSRDWRWLQRFDADTVAILEHMRAYEGTAPTRRDGAAQNTLPQPDGGAASGDPHPGAIDRETPGAREEPMTTLSDAAGTAPSPLAPDSSESGPDRSTHERQQEPGPSALHVDYGKIGGEFETDWQLTIRTVEDSRILAHNDHLKLTVEWLSPDKPAFLEIVGTPIAYRGEPGGVSEEDFWHSLEYVMHTLRGGMTVKRLFGPWNGFRQEQDSGLWVEEGKELTLSPQWTVGMHPSELLDFLVDDVRPMSEQSTDTAHLDAEIGAAFAREVAARFYASEHRIRVPHSALAWQLLDDVEYRSLAGLLHLVFTQAITGLHWRDDDLAANRSPERWFKSYTFALSRHDPSTLARALSPRARDFLNRNSEYVLRKFSDHARRALSDQYTGDPLAAPFSPGLTVRDYLQNFTQHAPRRLARQQAVMLATSFDELDGGKVLVELRDLPDAAGISQARETYDTLKQRAHARYEAAARRKAGGSAPRHTGYSGVLADAELADTVERLVRNTDALNTLRHRRNFQYQPIEHEAVQLMVRRVVQLAGDGNEPGGTLESAGEDLVLVSAALRKLDDDLSDFAHRFNLADFTGSWEGIRQPWAQAMRDVASLREALADEPSNWPPEDVMRNWVERSTLPGSESRSDIEIIDAAVAHALDLPDDTAALQDVLAEVTAWRGDNRDSERGQAVQLLERQVLHLLGGPVDQSGSNTSPEEGSAGQHRTWTPGAAGTPRLTDTPTGTGALPSRYPVLSSEVMELWQPYFRGARQRLERRRDGGSLRQQAASIVAEHHMVPPTAAGGYSAEAADYEDLHNRVVDVVAAVLGESQGEPDPRARAARFARDLAAAFGSGRPASGR
ncbi:WXG100-like domain-containing protein [Streptomyces sp. NPDC001020]